MLSDAKDTVNWDQQFGSSLEREEGDRKEREWEIMSVIEKCFIVGSRAQRDRELLLSWPPQQMFLVHRIRIHCTKVQTTQAFKTDPRQGSLPFPILSTESQTGF